MGNEISRDAKALHDSINNSKIMGHLREYELAVSKSFQEGKITKEEYAMLMKKVEEVRLQLFQIDKIKEKIDRGDYDKDTDAGTGLQRLKKALDELVKGGHLSDSGAHKIRGYMTERMLSGKESEDQGLQPTEDVGGVLDNQDD